MHPACGRQRSSTSPGACSMGWSGKAAVSSILCHRTPSLTPRATKRVRLFVSASGRRNDVRSSKTENTTLPLAIKEDEACSLSLANATSASKASTSDLSNSAASRRKSQRARHQLTYKIAAISASLGVTALAIFAVHYRFAWHVESGGEVPVTEAVLTVLLVFGGVVGMEMWARWAHKALWHDLPGGWALHKSHHEPRIGPFEANDIFAIINAVPAIGLCAYGFLTPTTFGGVCFGAGLGITLFGMMYMFVHDGLVHKRFPVGPLADVPYLKRVAAAHKLHHAERFNGVPWGLFLGPMELEAVGGRKDLDYMCRELEVMKHEKEL